MSYLDATPTNSRRASSWHKIGIDTEQLIVSATLAADTSNPTPLVIRTGLKLASCHELQLEQPDPDPRVKVDDLGQKRLKFADFEFG